MRNKPRRPASPAALKATLASYIDDELKGLAERGEPDRQEPTAGVHRVIRRAGCTSEPQGAMP
jgi:hypothetical protein